MTLRTYGTLLATLVAATAWGQEVSVYGTTLAQVWKQDTPGFEKATYAPATQFLGIDANNLYKDGLSLHLFGWGRADMANSTRQIGMPGGDLAYGYLRYRFNQANAELKAGRFTINQGVGIEQVDGISGRADLRGGFTVSFFGGKPVLYKRGDAAAQKDYEFQRDFIFGGRVGLRVPKLGEFGLSLLQDGTKAAKDLPLPSAVDYTRKQAGLDVRISPNSTFDFSGRTVYDLASHLDTPGAPSNRSRLAENDYPLSVKLAPLVAMTGNYTERNFQAYFAGTNLPSLFRQIEKDKHRAYGGSLIFGSAASVQVVADYRNIRRETLGDAKRFGGEFRMNLPEQKIQAGFGFHRMAAFNVPVVGGLIPSYGLSHREVRAWVMVEQGRLSASLDAIHQSYDDPFNPNLNAEKAASEVVASLGVQATSNLKISGDVSYGVNPDFKKDVRGLLRAEFRFAMGSKGGSK